MTIRDTYPIVEQTLTPNLTELLKSDPCPAAGTQGYRDISSLLKSKMLMAVWTFAVPAKKCFELEFYFSYLNGTLSTQSSNKLTIQDGQLEQSVVMKGRPKPFTYPKQNDTTTISVVYFHRSLSNSVYWRMLPSINCNC